LSDSHGGRPVSLQKLKSLALVIPDQTNGNSEYKKIILLQERARIKSINRRSWRYFQFVSGLTQW